MKNMQSLKELTPAATLDQIITADQKAGRLLASIGLDPSEHKDETLRSVCKQRQWSEVEVLQWIKKHRVAQNGSANENGIHQEADFGDNIVKWCDHLEENMHETNLKMLSEIDSDFPRVLQIHENQYTWLKNMKWHYEIFEEALQLYLAFEKKIFFNLIGKFQEQNKKILDGTRRQLERCMNIIEEDQKRLQNYMDTIQEKARGFESPSGACTTLRILNQNFKMLFENLEEQFQIERENILPIINQKIRNS